MDMYHNVTFFLKSFVALNWLERPTVNRKVRGSNPRVGVKIFAFLLFWLFFFDVVAWFVCVAVLLSFAVALKLLKALTVPQASRHQRLHLHQQLRCHRAAC